jgi:hypothetical protein
MFAERSAAQYKYPSGKQISLFTSLSVIPCYATAVHQHTIITSLVEMGEGAHISLCYSQFLKSTDLLLVC